MTLEELITALEAADPTLVLPHGFTNPHSYRGYYDDLAFEPATDVLVADMLNDARDALGETFEGWKGGEYKMRRGTDCWLAEEGGLGETLGPLLLHFMLAAGVRGAARQAAGQTPTTERTPDAEETQGHPAAELYVLLRKAGQDPDTAQQLIYAHAAMAVRQHTALNGDTTPAVEQPAEAQPAEAHPPREGWRIELLDVDGWMPSGLVRPDRELVAQYLAGRRKQRPDATFRLVRETTTWTVEEQP